MGAWEEMEAFESSTADSTGAHISSACFLGQYAFGVTASVIFNVMGRLLVHHEASDDHVHQPADYLQAADDHHDHHGDHVCAVDFLTAFGAAFGVFASSSGGGDPRLTTSGGGPLGFLAILVSATVAVLVSTLVLNGGRGGSAVPGASLAAGVATIVAGVAASVGAAVGAVRREREGGEREGGGRSVSSGAVEGSESRSYKNGTEQAVKKAVATAVGNEMTNPEILVRVGVLASISVGLHVFYSLGEADW